LIASFKEREIESVEIQKFNTVRNKQNITCIAESRNIKRKDSGKLDTLFLLHVGY
jgi:hypothetical protein